MGGETSRMSGSQLMTVDESDPLHSPRPARTTAFQSSTLVNSPSRRQRAKKSSKSIYHKNAKENAFVPDGDKENARSQKRSGRRCPSGDATSKKRDASQLEILQEPLDQTPKGGMEAIGGVTDDVLLELGSLTLIASNSDEGFPHGVVSSGVCWKVDFSECLDRMEELTNDGVALDRRLPRRFASQMFKLHMISSRLVWRLMWVPKDHDNESISLYLECMSCIPTDSPSVMARFSFSVDLVPGAQFGSERFLRLKDLPKFERGSSLSVEMRMEWCRDTLLFPPRTLTLSESKPEMYLVSSSPRIILIENFLTMSDCEKLISVAKPLVKRSRVSTGNETPSRTSSSMFFTRGLEEHPAVIDVENKISHLITMKDVHQGRKFEKSEALQAVQYHPGQFYSEHFDNRAGYAHLRAATVLCYLRDSCSGGATFFPKASGVVGSSGTLTTRSSSEKTSKRRRGVRVYPKRGRAIIFWSRKANGEEDSASLHAGEPLVKGEKWIVTRWLKEIDDPQKRIVSEE
ncbi:hypothetical protein BSKO_06229 [Bryopsis sp. KO-2023]|nr:hypothetical protein BSKO_06229 [Bryopsis sp. KO-2023]